MHIPTSFALPRRHLLLGTLLAATGAKVVGAPTVEERQDKSALVRRALQFPRDLGSHPQTAIEWWYVTGAVRAGAGRLGFQLTFFRSRVPSTQQMRSGFAARQLIFSHAAVTDLQAGRLLHDQRIARSSGQGGVDLASSSTEDTDVRLRDWRLHRDGEHYTAQVRAADFGFALKLQQNQPLLLQGDKGWSRKGPEAAQASFYYSVPQLLVSGELTLAGVPRPVEGRAWLDHEWSESMLHADAVGWDWIGMNLDNGSALTAFRLRTRKGDTLWAGGSWRAAGEKLARAFAPEDLEFRPGRQWRSTLSGTSYPVQWFIRVRMPGAGGFSAGTMWQTLQIRALLDNQELDSRHSTGAIYWEGLSELLDDTGRTLGSGYLEMTGYASPLRL